MSFNPSVGKHVVKHTSHLLRRRELSHPAEDWDVSDTCKHATCGFRSESLHHISQYRRLRLHRIQPTFPQRQPAEKHRRNTGRWGLRHVEAHRSKKELRLESLATDPVSEMKPIQLCAICGEPADIQWVTMSTGEFIRLWYCRGCWIDWNAQDNDANVNTVDEQELGASRCWSRLKWNSSFRRAQQWTSIRTQLKSTRWDELRNC